MQFKRPWLWAFSLSLQTGVADSNSADPNSVASSSYPRLADGDWYDQWTIDTCLTADQLFTPLNDLSRLRESAAAPATPLTPAQQAAFTNITHFASAAYCTSPTVMDWTCGPDCNYVSPNFRPIATGEQSVFGVALRWYVGWDPRNLDVSGNNRGNGTIIVGHQGTAFGQIRGLAQNALAYQQTPNQTLFPGTSSLLVHYGYSEAHAASADPIFAAVRQAMRQYNSSSIVATGHSQGAAVALYDGVSLKLRLGNQVSVSAITYAMPRTGNPAWADFVDRLNIYVRHVNNVGDPVPCTPPQSFTVNPGIPPFIPRVGYEFANAKGELHIQTVDGTWYDCPGHDNPSPRCSTGTVADSQIINIINIFDPQAGRNFTTYHKGPYNGILMGRQCLPPVRR